MSLRPQGAARSRSCRWAPAALTMPDIRAVTSLLGGVAVLAGLDYLVGNDEVSPNLTLVEAVFPLWVWGAALVAAGLHLVVGAVTRTHFAVWVGHALSCIVYVGLGIANAQTALTMDYADGIRTAGLLLVLLWVHAVLALRTGVRPVSIAEGKPVAVVLEAEGGP